MRIALENLELIRSNPDAFREEEEAEEDRKKHVTPGRNSHMQNALVKWRKGTLTVEEARQEMLTKCEKFKDKAGTKRVVRKFDRYVEDCETLDTETRFGNMLVKVPLPKGTDCRFKVEGRIRTLDKKPDGTYTATIFYKNKTDWKKELRLPLIQDALAQRLNLEPDEIEMCVYCFADAARHYHQFTQAEIEAARTELRNLLIKLASLAERESLPPQTAMEFDE